MGKVIGLDASLFIYLFEENARYIKKVERLLRALQQGEMESVFS